jgi:asparagine synthase (glutamine-hydrolysing)
VSAIAGLVRRDGQPIDPAELDALSASLAHRGPDGRNAWHGGPVGLVHCLLRVAPEAEHAAQPYQRDGRVITADVRLDNRSELCAALGLPLATQSDAELILAAYARWGEACAEHLLGDFAFAIWDETERQLFCARDYIGFKPFYYYASPRQFVFATELKGVLALPEVPRRLNEMRVADYLLPVFDDLASTFYQDLQRLPPGHCLSLSPTGVRVWPHYTLQPQPLLKLRSDAEYIEAFRERFEAAVRCRIRTPYPVGASLSGGLDSSSVVVQARALRGPQAAPLSVFSAVFDEVPASDERPYMEAVLAGGGLTSHFIRADLLSPLADLERMHWHEDEPFYAPNLFIDWALYRAAQAAGVRVMLDGQDGDSTVSHGLGLFQDLARSGRWGRAWREAGLVAGHFGSTRSRVLWRQAIRPLLPVGLVAAIRRLRRQPHGPLWRAAPIQLGFAQRLGWPERIRPWLEADARPALGESVAHWRKISQPIHTFYLEVGDREAAAFGLEVRSPFYDRRLVEFCLSVPGELKLRDGWTRWIMRRAMHGLLPPQVEWRGGKSNLGHNFRHVLLRYERDRLARWIAAPGALAEYVDVDRVRAAFARFQSAQGDADALLLWKVVTLGEWLVFAFGAVAPPAISGVQS